MMYAVWIALVLALAIMAWIAVNRSFAAFVLVVVSFPLLYGLQNLPIDTKPCVIDKEYAILGYKIKDEEKIYVMLDGEKPQLCTIPYTDGDAESLQTKVIGPDGKPGVATLSEGDSSSGGERVEYKFPKPNLPEKD